MDTPNGNTGRDRITIDGNNNIIGDGNTINLPPEQDTPAQQGLHIYLDRMAKLLLEKELRQSVCGDEVRGMARAYTLTVLSNLDGVHKGQIILFLYENTLINRDNPIVDLSGADLRSVHLPGATLQDADLHGADLSHANLHQALLRDANLESTNLAHAELQQTNFWGAHLQRANLQNAHLQDSCLRYANLKGADLQQANLEKANLWDANLQGANFQGARLHGADLCDAFYNPGTTWPEHFDPQAAGAYYKP